MASHKADPAIYLDRFHKPREAGAEINDPSTGNIDNTASEDADLKDCKEKLE